MTKPLLLGLRRSDDLPHGEALDPVPSGSGRRLHQLTGLPLDVYNATFDRANATFDRANAADEPSLHGRRVIVLGRGAWQRAGLAPVEWFTTTYVPHLKASLTLIPHPSGRCRLYNDPAIARRARQVILDAAGLQP